MIDCNHSHHNIDKVIRNTRCISNRVGYISHSEHHTFRSDAMFKI